MRTIKETLQAIKKLLETGSMKNAEKLASLIGVKILPTRKEWGDFPDAIVNATLSTAAIHPDYQLAKNGNTASALRLVGDTLTNSSIEKIKATAKGKDPVLVSVHALEDVSINQIPSAMAVLISKKTGWDIETSIIQSKKVGRTSAPDGFYRIVNQPTFEGYFPKGRNAIILDDTLTQGGTFASLKAFIESNGGVVIAAIALTGKQYSAKLSISSETLSKLRGTYGDLEAWFKVELGYGFDKLTESEARYIINSKQDADTIRDKIIAAKQA